MDSDPLTVIGTLVNAIGYVKASNADIGDTFGRAIALRGGGNTLAVVARTEDSAASGINGNQTDNSAASSGAVYVFVRSNGLWQQQAYLKASNPGVEDYFGDTISLSLDGSALAIGAPGEAGLATGIKGDQSGNLGVWAGAVYLY